MELVRSRNCGLLALLFTALGVSSAAARPNIVFVIMDDFGVDRVGAYSPDTAGPTPNLDDMAAQGVRFANFWGQQSCSPFRASALTGLPVRGHSIAGPIDIESKRRRLGLDPSLDTLPRRLALLGYRSEVIGKWHLAGEPDFTPRHPLLAGFDHHAGTLGNPGQDGSDYYDFNKCVDGVCEQVVGRYLTTDTTDDAIAALSGSEPFFLWIGYNAAHKPFHVPPAHLHSAEELHCPHGDHTICHKALIESLDSELGRLFRAIDWSDTTVIAAADNGTPKSALGTGRFLELRRPNGGKGSVYDSGVHVPLIVRGSAVAPEAEGKVAQGLTQVEDIFATVLDLAGVSAETAHSRSFGRMLVDPASPSRRPWQYVERYAPNGPGPSSDPDRRHYVAAATDRYKVVVRRHRDLAGTPELYDRFDHGERVDLYPPERNSEQDEALTLLLDVIDRHGVMSPPGAAPQRSLSGPIAALLLGGALAVGGWIAFVGRGDPSQRARFRRKP